LRRNDIGGYKPDIKMFLKFREREREKEREREREREREKEREREREGRYRKIVYSLQHF